MDNKILLQLAAARVALDKGSLTLDQYKQMLNKITEIKEEINYEKKLRQFKMDEAKNKIIKNSLLTV